jgi:ABC-type branched-subunit amino acid transport system substrate-binding protein
MLCADLCERLLQELFAIEELNAQRGGVNGRQLLPLIFNGDSAPATFAQHLRHVVQNTSVGPYGAVSSPASFCVRCA